MAKPPRNVRRAVRATERFVVKVQLSEYSTLKTVLGEQERRVLVYNHDKSIQFEGPADSKLVNSMKDMPKKYCWARKLGPTLDIDFVTDVPIEECNF